MYIDIYVKKKYIYILSFKKYIFFLQFPNSKAVISENNIAASLFTPPSTYDERIRERVPVAIF